MSFINDVRVVGQLLEKPEIKTSGANRKYAVMDIRTGKPFKKGGKTEWIFQKHRIVCFKQDALDFLGKRKKGDWLKVLGELRYYQGSNSAQVVVAEFGDIGGMFEDQWVPDAEITDEEYALLESCREAAGEEDKKPSDAGKKGADKPAPKDDIDDIPF